MILVHAASSFLCDTVSFVSRSSLDYVTTITVYASSVDRASFLSCTCCLAGRQYTIGFLRFCKQVRDEGVLVTSHRFIAGFSVFVVVGVKLGHLKRVRKTSKMVT